VCLLQLAVHLHPRARVLPISVARPEPVRHSVTRNASSPCSQVQEADGAGPIYDIEAAAERLPDVRLWEGVDGRADSAGNLDDHVPLTP